MEGEVAVNRVDHCGCGSNGDGGQTVHWDCRCTGRAWDLQQQGWDDVAFCEEPESQNSLPLFLKLEVSGVA